MYGLAVMLSISRLTTSKNIDEIQNVKIFEAPRILTAALAQANFLLSDIMEGRHENDSLHLMLRWPAGPGPGLHCDKKPQWVKSFLKQHSHFQFRNMFSKNIKQYQKSRNYLERM